MLTGSCTVGGDTISTSFGGPGDHGGPGGGDTATTSQGSSTGTGTTGAATQAASSGSGGVADETADASGAVTTSGGSTGVGSSGNDPTNVTSMGSTGEAVCDEYCNGCACPSAMCSMCCAGIDKVDVCQGGSCFCF